MSYTLAKITSFYPGYLRNYYERFPGITEKSYSEQFDHLMSDSFGWADYFAKNLRLLGVNAHEIVFNIKPLQETWGKENNVKNNELKHILIEQLRSIKPDVLFIEDAFKLNGDWVEYVRKEIPSVKQVFGWCAVNYSKKDFDNFKPFDYMLSCTPGFRDEFIRNGKKSYLLYHAFEKNILTKIEPMNEHRDKDIIFIGSIILQIAFHLKRLEILKKLNDAEVKLEIYSVLKRHDKYKNFLKQIYQFLRKFFSFLKSPNMQAFPMNIIDDYNTLCSICKTPVYGIEMFRTMSKAKICFNNHIDAAGEYAGNMRLFEATGVGTCLLTDHKKNIPEIFEADKEIVTYKSVDECIEKTLWLLSHDKAREEIALSGQKRVLKEHTYYHRAEQLNDIIAKNF